MFNLLTSYYKKLGKISIIISLVATCIGCGDRIRMSGSYEEGISQIYITKDEKNLVAIGNKYNYILKAPKDIIETLKSPYHRYVSARFVSFKVDSNNIITGNYRLNLSKKLKIKKPRDLVLIRQAHELCYKRNGHHGFICEGKLVGTRYKSEDIKLPHTVTKLNRLYKILISESGSFTKETLEKDTTTVHSPGSIAIMPILAIGMGVATLFNKLEH